MTLKKKLVGGRKLFFILILLIISKLAYSAQIYDYQTERFIEKINKIILSANNYEKNINFKIIIDDFPNALVTEDNTIYISSGLIINSPDYVSLLAVIAHEIGHIEKFHIVKKKNQILNLKKINSIGNIAAIAGSMLIKQPELINGIIVNQTALTNVYFNFSQDQEKEADIYALETLKKLNLPTKSIIEFLNILENKSKFNLIDNELKKFSTHPLFSDRIKLIDSPDSNGNGFDPTLQKEFNYIKAKFMAYRNFQNTGVLGIEEKIYYLAIKNALDGNLKNCLKRLNTLIHKNKDNIFFMETKADILISYGYNKEAINFYMKVLEKYPHNNYAKYNIFINEKFDKSLKDHKKKIENNINLLKLFPNNKNLIKKFYELSLIIDEKEWIIFFKILLSEEHNIRDELVQLYKKTKDNNLKKLINMYI